MATKVVMNWATKDEKRAKGGSMKQAESCLVQVGFLAIEGEATLVYNMGAFILRDKHGGNPCKEWKFFQG